MSSRVCGSVHVHTHTYTHFSWNYLRWNENIPKQETVRRRCCRDPDGLTSCCSNPGCMNDSSPSLSVGTVCDLSWQMNTTSVRAPDATEVSDPLHPEFLKMWIILREPDSIQGKPLKEGLASMRWGLPMALEKPARAHPAQRGTRPRGGEMPVAPRSWESQSDHCEDLSSADSLKRPRTLRWDHSPAKTWSRPCETLREDPAKLCLGSWPMDTVR